MKDLQIALDNILTDKIVNLKPENLKEGVSCLGVKGSLKILDTSDATAQQSDIFQGKTAYVNGEKITGTFVQNLGTKKITENGTYNASDDDLNGYSSVEVETSGVDINDYYIMNSINGIKLSIFIKTIPKIDTSLVTNMNNFFSDCTNMTSIPLIDTSKVTNMKNMFYNCNNLVSVPLLDTSLVTNMQSMFTYCRNLQSVPQFNTSKVTDMSYMFNTCNKITKIPLFDTTKVTNMQSIFSNCSNLINVPLLDTSKVTLMSSMFDGCISLTNIPALDTSNVIQASRMFSNDTKIETIPKLNANKIIDITSILSYCRGLKNFGGLENLGMAYSTTVGQNSSSYSLFLDSCENLTHDSLMNVINNLYDIATKGCKAQKLILGTTNLAKLTEEEIAIATNKGWNVT
jgi:surface protein